MNVLFDSKFSKKIDKIKNPDLAKRIFRAIQNIKKSEDISKIPNLKRLSGHANMFRYRIGDYRIGLELVNENTLEFLDFDKRNDFYKSFP